MTATYVVGDFATVVTEDGVVLTAPDRLSDVVALAERGLDPLTVVEVLSGGSLSDLPDFVAARISQGEVRVVVRGAFAVRTEGLSVDGLGVATWREVAAPLVADAAVEVVPTGARPEPGAAALPLAAGVVRSGGVTWTPRPVEARAAAQPAAASGADSLAATTLVSPAVDERTSARVGRSATADAVEAPPAEAATAPPAQAVTTPPPPRPPQPPPTRGPAPAGVPPVAPSPPPTVPVQPVADPADPDHDGRTITPAQLQALRGAPGAPGAVAPPAGRPVVAVALSNGRVVPVRRRVLIGRSPRIQQVGGSANLPALITVDDPYVSSTHLEVMADGGRVTVTDTSTNGTLLARRGGAPVPLDPGVPTEVAVGDVLTLSKGLTATLVPAQGW